MKKTRDDVVLDQDGDERPWNQPDYLGQIYIRRPQDSIPSPAVHVLRAAEDRLRYANAHNEQIILRPRDRGTSIATIEDDSPARIRAFRAALLADRWQHVEVRG